MYKPLLALFLSLKINQPKFKCYQFVIRFCTLPQVLLQRCKMPACLLLINLVPVDATKDLNLHRHIVKVNTLLSVLEIKWPSFCSWAHSQCGLTSVLGGLSLLYFLFALFSRLLSGNSSWTGLFIPQETASVYSVNKKFKSFNNSIWAVPSDSLLRRNVSYSNSLTNLTTFYKKK